MSEYAPHHQIRLLRMQVEACSWDLDEASRENNRLSELVEFHREQEQRLRELLFWPHQVTDLLVDHCGLTWDEAEHLLDGLVAEPADPAGVAA